MTALIPELFIAVTPTLIRTFGANRAIVLQHIHYRSLSGHSGEKGEAEMSQAVIAEDTGLSKDTVYRSLKQLLEAKVIHIVRADVGQADGGCDRTRTYAIDHDRLAEVVGQVAEPREGVIPRNRDGSSRGTPNTHLTREEKPCKEVPPVVPQGGHDSPADRSLFDAGNQGATTREEKQRASIDPAFAVWWDGVPQKVGARKQAGRAWAKARREGASTAELSQAIGNYFAARAAYLAHWGRNPTPKPAHISTTIGKRDLWEGEQPDPLKAAEYWPAPKGCSWEDPGARPTKLRDELADVMAERDAQIQADKAERDRFAAEYSA